MEQNKLFSGVPSSTHNTQLEFMIVMPYKTEQTHYLFSFCHKIKEKDMWLS